MTVFHLLSVCMYCFFFFFFSSRRRHTRYWRDWSSDVCSSDLVMDVLEVRAAPRIDRLRVVANRHHVAMIAGEQIDEVSLDFVRVLIFIYEDELKLSAIKFRYPLVLLKHR